MRTIPIQPWQDNGNIGRHQFNNYDMSDLTCFIHILYTIKALIMLKVYPDRFITKYENMHILCTYQCMRRELPVLTTPCMEEQMGKF